MREKSVVIKGLTFKYPSASAPALSDVDLEIDRGNRIILVGENGAGKSTLLGLIAGQTMCPEGTITVFGLDAFRAPELQKRIALITSQWVSAVTSLHNARAMELVQSACGEPGLTDRARLLLSVLGIEEGWHVGSLSEGQLRRVQLAVKLCLHRDLVLLDEATTDLDLVVRRNLLTLLFEESSRCGTTIVYCTHIFDGLEGWASHVVQLSKGKIRRINVTGEHEANGSGVEMQRLSAGSMFTAVRDWFMEDLEEERRRKVCADHTAVCSAARVNVGNAPSSLAVHVDNLTWAYSTRSRVALRGATLEVPAGARLLLTGLNGAGKTTMMSIIAGQHYIRAGQVLVQGRPAFHDLTLQRDAILLSQEWRRTLKQVGVGGNISFADLAKSIIDDLRDEGWDEAVLSLRLAHLVTCLEVDTSWQANQVSDGQLRRMQLALKLTPPRSLILLDEASVDLDVIARQALLAFLQAESSERGATVVYCTHILDGLGGWATHHCHVGGGAVSAYGESPLAMPLHAASQEGVAGSVLYRTVQGLLVEDLKKGAGGWGDDGNAPQSAGDVGMGGGGELPPMWKYRENTQAGAYGNAKFSEKDGAPSDSIDTATKVVSAESISKLLDGEEAMRLEEERARVEEEARRVAEMERMLRERQEREKEREAAEAQASAEAAQRSVAVRAALAAAIGSLTDKTQTLGQAVGSGEADDIEAARKEVETIWQSLQPAFGMLAETLPRRKPASGGAGASGTDLPWGFGSRTNTLAPDELIRTGRILDPQAQANSST